VTWKRDWSMYCSICDFKNIIQISHGGYAVWLVIMLFADADDSDNFDCSIQKYLMLSTSLKLFNFVFKVCFVL